MHKIIAIGLVVLGSFMGAVAVAPAAAVAASAVPSCSSTTNIADNATSLTQQLRGYGYDVQSLEEWSGCLRATVDEGNGKTYTAYFDPDTLQLLSSNKAEELARG